jgi:hypothetical protein
MTDTPGGPPDEPAAAAQGFDPTAGISFPPQRPAPTGPLRLPSQIGPALVSLDLFNRVPAPSEAELSWVDAAAGRALSPDEAAQLQRISSAYLASREGLPGPSSQELGWVLAQLQAWEAGQAPSEPERLRDLLARFALELQSQLQAQLKDWLAQLPDPPAAPSQAERHWASQLKQAALAGRPPSAEDFHRYGLILAACLARGLDLG